MTDTSDNRFALRAAPSDAGIAIEVEDFAGEQWCFMVDVTPDRAREFARRINEACDRLEAVQKLVAKLDEAGRQPLGEGTTKKGGQNAAPIAPRPSADIGATTPQLKPKKENQP